MNEEETHAALAQAKAFRNYIDGVLNRPRRKHEDSDDEYIPLTGEEGLKIAGRFKRICSKLRILNPAVFSDLMKFPNESVYQEIELQEMRSELTYCIDTLEHTLEHRASAPALAYEGSDDYSRTNTPFGQEEQRMLVERVDEIEAFMVKSVSEDKGETQGAEVLKEFIQTEFSEVKERLTKVGRRDWRMFFLNTIVNIGITAGFSPEARLVISQYIFTIISIIQNSKLLTS